MSDSRRLHASCVSVLQSVLSGEDFRHLDIWAWAITGLLLQKTSSLPGWIGHLPDEADAFGREQRFRRWLNNGAVKVRRLYQPFLSQALVDWSGHTLYMGLDTTSVANRLVIARTAVIYRGRAVPLAWQVFKRRSVMLAFDQYTATLLPAGVNVVLLADRGFRDVRLMALLRQLHWHFRLRLAQNESVWLNQQRLSLAQWPLQPYQPCFLQGLELTDQHYGPVNVAMAWDGQTSHDPWRIVSDQPAEGQTLTEYALRMGIDLGFLDDKSAGFQLEDSELLLPPAWIAYC